MKIAFVYNAVYPIKGGAEKKIYEIGRKLADKYEGLLVHRMVV